MDPTADIREFLTTRRAKLTPAVAGLPGFGGRRRVPGLRREEVSLLAGISVEYYVRLERGNATGISDSVLDGISRALQLNQAEDAHLRDLVHAANQGVRTQRRRPATRTQQVSAGTQRLLDAMSEIPAIVQNGRMDIVATNPLGRALFSELFMEASGPPNFARFLFLDPRARSAYRHWSDSTEQIVALLRAASGRTPWDAALRELIEELTDRSREFRELWGALTTCVCTSLASSSSTIPTWATSISSTRRCNSPPTLDSSSSASRPSPARPPTTRCASSAA